VDIQGQGSAVTINATTATAIFSTTIPGDTINPDRCVTWYAAFTPSATGLTYRMYYGSDYANFPAPSSASPQVWSGAICYLDATKTQITLHSGYSTQGVISFSAVGPASDQVLALKAFGGGGTATVTPHRWILSKVE
jgi:hypothetical protein